MLEKRYVVDTNVIVAWLLKPNGLSGKIIRSLELELYTPYKAIGELWKNRPEWDKRNPNIDLARFIDQLRYYIHVQHVDQNSPHMVAAKNLMNSIDPNDADFVALALVLDAPIWSYDPHFERQSRVKVVRSDYILRNSPDIPTLWEELQKEFFAMGRKRSPV